MKEFIKDILEEEFNEKYIEVYNNSELLKYLDSKMGAVYGDSKTRRSLANIYAIYSIIYFYSIDFYGEDRTEYENFKGYEYIKLFKFYRKLYGGEKLQNHALNSRVNGEFLNKFNNNSIELIIVNNGKYLLHPNYLFFNEIDLSIVIKKIIEKYIILLKEKDNDLLNKLQELEMVYNLNEKKEKIYNLISETSEARIFEIISYAILKNYYKKQTVFIGKTREELEEKYLELYKTGRTNANDGGIDFVMRPLGRFFQVTEVDNYDKYLLDMDKVLHFPITFVIKTQKLKEEIENDIKQYIEERSGGMIVIKERYKKAIEEIITINELKEWLMILEEASLNEIIRDIDIYYKLELNIPQENDN